MNRVSVVDPACLAFQALKAWAENPAAMDKPRLQEPKEKLVMLAVLAYLAFLE